MDFVEGRGAGRWNLGNMGGERGFGWIKGDLKKDGSKRGRNVLLGLGWKNGEREKKGLGRVGQIGGREKEETKACELPTKERTRRLAMIKEVFIFRFFKFCCGVKKSRNY